MASAALAESHMIPPKQAIPPRERLIVALDVPTVEAARALVTSLGDSVQFFKIGMQLQFGGGLDYARHLIDQGKKVFLDSKLFDIDETIERAVENVGALGVDFLTVHGNGKTIRAAVRGRERSNTALKLFSVTVLTSLDNFDMADIYGEGAKVEDFVKLRAENAFAAGADGVIASAHEVELIRQLVARQLKVMDTSETRSSPDFNIITPGIRFAEGPVFDQKRVMSPYDAIKAGADYLVVGRPVYQSDDPKRSAELIMADIERAL